MLYSKSHEPMTESLLPGGEMPGETTPEESVIIEDINGTVPEGGTAETLADGTVVAPVQTLQNSIVNVSMTMTFYETAYGAESLDGLIIEKIETPEAVEEAG